MSRPPILTLLSKFKCNSASTNVVHATLQRMHFVLFAICCVCILSSLHFVMFPICLVCILLWFHFIMFAFCLIFTLCFTCILLVMGFVVFAFHHVCFFSFAFLLYLHFFVFALCQFCILSNSQFVVFLHLVWIRTTITFRFLSKFYLYVEYVKDFDLLTSQTEQ